MRRLLVSIVILLLAVGAIFYFGWVQLKLGPDTYGVIFLKTNGYESTIVRPGTFVWRWQALLPTNLTLLEFPITQQRANLSISGSLPSGALYGQYLDGHPDFAFRLTFTVVYSLRPDALPNLAARDHLQPGALDGWYKGFAAQCQSVASQFLLYGAGGKDFPSPGLLQSELARRLEAAFPDIRFIDVSFDTIDLPDLALYQEARAQYLSVLRAEQSARQSAAVTKTMLDAEAAQKIELLKQYGELFNQYPVLLKYLDLAPSKRQNVIPGF